MKSGTFLGSLTGGRWRRNIAAVLAVTLLLPVPAMALVFIGPWDIFTERTGGAPAPRVQTTDTANGSTLTIGMRAYSARREATSTVVATRTFRANSEGEVLQVSRSFTSRLRNAYAYVDVRVNRLTGHTRFRIPTIYDAAGGQAQTFSPFDVRSKFLTGGLYQIVVAVVYSKQANGSWNNSSPHQFTFTGI